MMREILKRIDFQPGQRVLDIGCGDASLLSEIPFVASRVGTVITAEELERLKSAPHLDGIEFRIASFDDLEEVPGPFDRIVVNSCFHFTATTGNARRALAGIAERLAPGGQLWLGELFSKKYNREFHSKFKAVRHVFRQLGPCYAIAFIGHLYRRRHRAERFIFPSERVWYVSPEQVGQMGKEVGLDVAGLWSCQEMTGDAVYARQDRFSVLLRKA